MLSDLKDRLWRSRWISWLLLLAVFVLAAVALRTFLDYRSAAMDLVLEVNQQVTHLSAVRVQNELSKFSDALVTLARTQDMSSKNPVLQTRALRQALPIREGLFDGGIVLLDNFGKVTAVEPERPELLGADWSRSRPFSASPKFGRAGVLQCGDYRPSRDAGSNRECAGARPRWSLHWCIGRYAASGPDYY